jgi:hypothetical protein
MSLPIIVGTFGCPSATVTAAVQSAVCQLVGFMEFGTLSVPPVLYLSYTATGGWSWTSKVYGEPTWTIAGAGTGATAGWEWNATTGNLAGGSSGTGVYDSTRTSTNQSNVTHTAVSADCNVAALALLLSTDGATPSGAGLVGALPGDPLAAPSAYIGGEFAASFAINSQTQATVSMAAQSNNYSGGHTVPGGYTDAVTAGSLVFNLSNPDTAANALARATLGSPTSIGPDSVASAFGDGIYSLWETRAGAGATAFGYQTGTYQLNCVNLVPGLQYHYVVVWEERTAAGNGGGGTSGYGSTWSNSDTASGDFTPTGSSYAVTGLTIPLAQGYQKRIKSITITAIGI